APSCAGKTCGDNGCGGSCGSCPSGDTCSAAGQCVALPPSNLSYSLNPALYTKGWAITPNRPSSSGGPVASFSVSPALPVGLSIDTSTGVITGTPTAVAASASYAVTATNSAGDTAANVSITVREAPMVQAIASGGFHNCAVVDGGVWCWGFNGF